MCQIYVPYYMTHIIWSISYRSYLMIAVLMSTESHFSQSAPPLLKSTKIGIKCVSRYTKTFSSSFQCSGNRFLFRQFQLLNRISTGGNLTVFEPVSEIRFLHILTYFGDPGNPALNMSLERFSIRKF